MAEKQSVPSIIHESKAKKNVIDRIIQQKEQLYWFPNLEIATK